MEITTESSSVKMGSALESLVDWIKNDLGTDYIVVGSIALNVCGWPLKSLPHDIDVEILVNDKNRGSIKSQLATLDRAHNVASHYEDSDHFTFEWRGVTVDAWIVTELKKNYVWKDYIKYATVSEILQKKLSYARKKDLLDLVYAEVEFCKMIPVND